MSDLTQFCCNGHLCAKNYKIWCTFDEVLTKAMLTVFFSETRCTSHGKTDTTYRYRRYYRYFRYCKLKIPKLSIDPALDDDAHTGTHHVGQKCHNVFQNEHRVLCNANTKYDALVIRKRVPSRGKACNMNRCVI